MILSDLFVHFAFWVGASMRLGARRTFYKLKCMTLRVFSYATDAEQIYRLTYSAAKLGLDITVSGLGEPWLGWEQRLQAVRRFMSDGAAEDDIVMVVDGYDGELRECDY